MLGTGGKSAVKRAVRVHGNFAEHAPFALLLISMTKMRAAASWVVHTLCRVLAIGCVSQASGVSQADEVLEFRVIPARGSVASDVIRRGSGHSDSVVA